MSLTVRLAITGQQLSSKPHSSHHWSNWYVSLHYSCKFCFSGMHSGKRVSNPGNVKRHIRDEPSCPSAEAIRLSSFIHANCWIKLPRWMALGPKERVEETLRRVKKPFHCIFQKFLSKLINMLTREKGLRDPS